MKIWYCLYFRKSNFSIIPINIIFLYAFLLLLCPIIFGQQCNSAINNKERIINCSFHELSATQLVQLREEVREVVAAGSPVVAAAAAVEEAGDFVYKQNNRQKNSFLCL